MPVAKIVILNWNGAEHLRRFLPSVVAAAPEGVGVVVADNGSDDDSAAFLRKRLPEAYDVAVARQQTFVFTPVMSTFSIPRPRRISFRLVPKKALGTCFRNRMSFSGS